MKVVYIQWMGLIKNDLTAKEKKKQTNKGRNTIKQTIYKKGRENKQKG